MGKPSCPGGPWLLQDLANPQGGDNGTKLEGCLQRTGLDVEAARHVQGMLQKAAGRLLVSMPTLNSPATPSAEAFWVPGRIEVAGKHTDYAGGRSLLVAVNRGFAVVATPRNDARVKIATQFADGREDTQELEMSADIEQLHRFQRLPFDQGGWAAYPAAAVQRLVSNFGISRGADISIECNLPEASGMSSSSAVICYMWLVLDKFNDISTGNPVFARSIQSAADLYTFLGNIENGKHYKPGQPGQLDGTGGVGTFGGSEDHTAIMSCSNGATDLWQYCPAEHLATVSADPDVCFVVAVSGAKAEKTGNAMSGYNDASLLSLWAAAAVTVARAIASGIDAAKRPLTAQDLASIFDKTSLYNHSVPNLAEVVRQERAELGDGNDAIKTSIKARLDSVANTFKELLAVSAPSLGLNLDGLESPRVDINTLKVRFETFFNESEVFVPGIALAFATRDYASLGRLADLSHEAAVEELQNTVPETAWLPRWARGKATRAHGESASGPMPKRQRPAPRDLGTTPEAGTALAASSFGAGFGGSCWALVRATDADAFCRAWRTAYDLAFPPQTSGQLERTFFVVKPCPGAFIV